ncbi:TPA: SGNH/GDSL hydrolase family protein [Escherichia coli]|nr:SGNH/GDSL hydrolase family protein [Escherichia coli]
MKKIVLTIALMPVIAMAESPYRIDEGPISFYGITNKINKMKLSQAPKNNYLFFGDSIVQGLNPNKMHMSYVNLGIGGDTVHGVFKRVKETPIEKYDGVLLSVGANNFLQGESGWDLGDEIMEVIDYAAPKAKRLFVMETFVPNRVMNSSVSADFASANAKIHTACAKYKNCQVIPMPEGMIGKDGLKRDYSIYDGIHLNAMGYTLWKRELNKKMADFPVNYYYRARY